MNGPGTPTPLFRREVLDARRARWAGDMVLATPVPMRVATLVSAVVLAGVIAFAVETEFTRRVHVAGTLIPGAGAIRAVAPQFAQVVSVKVRDGESVKAGAVLYELAADRVNAGSSADTRIEGAIRQRSSLIGEEQAIQVARLREQAGSLAAQVRDLQEEIDRLRKEAGFQQARRDSAAKMLERFAGLSKQGFVSEVQVAQMENDFNEQSARYQALERSRIGQERQLLSTQQQQSELVAQSRLLEHQNDGRLASLQQELAEQESRHRIEVLSPVDGIVTTLAYSVGQSVPAGAQLATVLPDGSELVACLLVPSRAVGFVEAGQETRLRVSAFPYQKFGQPRGRVVSVDQSPISSAGGCDVPAPPQQNNGDAIYRAIVRLEHQSILGYGRAHALRAGMMVEADIQQDRRPLYKWLFDPIMSANETGGR